MSEFDTKKMVLVYDIRRDNRWRQQLERGATKQWEAYLRGEAVAEFFEGHIAEFFYAPYEGEHMFRLDEAKQKSTWARLGDDSWYVLGRRAKIERIVFHISHLIEDTPVVTRIWIGAE
jgi:hypothetical protein